MRDQRRQPARPAPPGPLTGAGGPRGVPRPRSGGGPEYRSVSRIQRVTGTGSPFAVLLFAAALSGCGSSATSSLPALAATPPVAAPSAHGTSGATAAARTG